MKPPLRTKSVSTKVSEAEFALLEERARSVRADPLGVGSGRSFECAGRSRDRTPASWRWPRFSRLRSLFLNLQFRSDKAPLTEAEMRGLIERADGTKMQRARERLEAVRTESKKDANETQPEGS